MAWDRVGSEVIRLRLCIDRCDHGQPGVEFRGGRERPYVNETGEGVGVGLDVVRRFFGDQVGKASDRVLQQRQTSLRRGVLRLPRIFDTQISAPTTTPQNAPLTPKSVMPLAAIRKVRAGASN